jgi:hypothetical protein
MKAIMACYGVPSSLLTIMEFGGPQDPDSSRVSKFTYDDRTAAISLDGSSYVNVAWKASPQPNAVELQFNTTASTQTTLINKLLLRIVMKKLIID